MKQVVDAISETIKQLFNLEVAVELQRPKPEFGDFATNVAMQLAGRLGQNPRQLAEQIAEQLSTNQLFSAVEIAGPGFINLKLTDVAIVQTWSLQAPQIYDQQSVVVEYSDPNAFKVLHAGHFYTSVVGDAIAKLVEKAGGQVHRTNFGGDVGLHVGKTMWAVLRELGGEHPEKLADINPDERADWLAKCYVAGTGAYEDDPEAKAQITDFNKRVYQIHADNDRQSPFAQIYWQTRDWSYDYFKAFYQRIGSHFDKFYPESMTATRGYQEVQRHIGTVFEKSDGAVVFRGEQYGLHTRVFINGEGLPTYETKDVGLIYLKYDDWKFDKSIIITADEQKEYMKVVLKALEQFAPELSRATLHITHGIVKLAGGVKMSSRKGNFLRAVDVIDYANAENQAENGVNDERVSLGAIKYAFLKPRIGGDVIYDPKESVSLVGNSGPYLQYSHARACSIIKKAGGVGDNQPQILDFDANERALAVKLGQYREVLAEATTELVPHVVCTYLYELAQSFNRFYEQAKIVGDPRQGVRLRLVEQYRQVLADGLDILGIIAPETM